MFKLRAKTAFIENYVSFIIVKTQNYFTHSIIFSTEQYLKEISLRKGKMSRDFPPKFFMRRTQQSQVYDTRDVLFISSYFLIIKDIKFGVGMNIEKLDLQ